MNWFDIEAQFKYIDSLDKNCFASCTILSYLSRKVCTLNLNCLSETEALKWIICGDEPKHLKKSLQYKKTAVSRSFLHVLDELCYIDDNDIKDAVLITMKKSIENNHLIYEYNNIIDDCKKSRVRVICNILWNDVQFIQNEDKILL